MSDIYSRVEEAIEAIRPAIQMDGGDIELVGVEDNIATVRLKGACVGCSMASMTLTHGVEATVKEYVPEIERVEALFY